MSKHVTISPTEAADRLAIRELVEAYPHCADFTPDGVPKAREIEERLMNETWRSSEYDLFPKLARLRVPALAIHGEHDLVPVECARRTAEAIHGARFVLLDGLGHFPYLEAPDAVRKTVVEFLA